MPKFKKNKKIRYDLTLPGYNYLGPFNALDKGTPTTESDAAALRHDKSKDYESPWAYIYFNEADDILLKELEGQHDYGAKAARTYFQWKKKTMPRLKKDDSTLGKRSNISPKNTESKRLRSAYPDLDPNPISNAHAVLRGSITSQNTMEGAGTSEDIEPATNLAMARSSGGGMQSNVGHETPVTIPRTISYGFPDTWTCVMPLNLTFSVIAEGPKRPAMLSIRMNSIYDCIANGSTSVYTGTVTNTTNFGSKIAATQSVNAITNDSFISSNANYTNFGIEAQQPAWRPFFEQRYSKYHVLGCEWELSTRIANVSTAYRIRGAVATMYHGRELPPVDGLTLADMMYWKDLDQVEYVQPQSNETPLGSNATTLSGRYKPGQHRREVREDEDAKTWTDTDAAPSLQENLAIYFTEAPLSWVPLADDEAMDAIWYNCFLTLKYIVQWKDLALAWKYPTSSTTDFAPQYNYDI